MNLPNFWYGSCSYGPLSANGTLYSGKILIWRNLANLRPFFGQNWLFWEFFFTSNLQTPLWIFLIFCMEVFLMVLFEKIILYIPGKFWYGEFLAMEYRNFVHLRPILEILAYNFQTPLWIFLNFIMEVFLIVFFEKIILYMPGKFWYGKILVI